MKVGETYTEDDAVVCRTSEYQGAASVTGFRGAASATGDYGVASATGDYGAASATGDYGVASATGDYGAATATGVRGAASATGARGAASATGEHSIAHADGFQSKAEGASGCAITLVERATDGAILAAAAVIVGQTHDGQLIEPDVYYTLRNGRVVCADGQV